MAAALTLVVAGVVVLVWWLSRSPAQRFAGFARRSEADDLRQLIGYIASGGCSRVCLLTGAGMSAGAGIRPFQGPPSANGVYDTLRPELLTATEQQRALMRQTPRMLFSWAVFQENQFPWLEARRQLIIDLHEAKYKPTPAHYLARILHERGILSRLVTQNIDGLDSKVGVSHEKVSQLHGRMADVFCEFCQADYPADEFVERVKSHIKDISNPANPEAPARSRHIMCKNTRCGRPGVKPRTLLVGRNYADLPGGAEIVEAAEQAMRECDLLIIIGTQFDYSLPCSLTRLVPRESPRVFINLSVVENLSDDSGPLFEFDRPHGRDLFLQGPADRVVVEKLLRPLGWESQLHELRN